MSFSKLKTSPYLISAIAAFLILLAFFQFSQAATQEFTSYLGLLDNNDAANIGGINGGSFQVYKVYAKFQNLQTVTTGQICVGIVGASGKCINITLVPNGSVDLTHEIDLDDKGNYDDAWAGVAQLNNEVAVTGTAWGRRVEITDFSSNKSSAEVGQSFTVSWSTDQATTVDLFWEGSGGSGALGNLNSSSSSTFTCSSVGTATFQLNAYGPTGGGFGTVSQTIGVSCVSAGGTEPLPGSFNLSGSCSAVNSSTNRADLSWTNSSNADSYKVERKTWSAGSWGQVGTTTGTSFSENVSNDADYYYRAFAINSTGSTFSSPTELFVCGAIGGAPLPSGQPPLPSGQPPPPPPPDEAVLYVNSSGASGVTIGYVSGTSGTDGTTNYSRSYTSNISTRIRATSTALNGAGFSSWSGCDSVQNPRDCSVAVNIGSSKTVTANYIIQNAPPPPPPPPPSFTCVAFRANDGVHYMVAEGGGGPGYTMNANRTAIGDWEKFSVVDRGGGKVALKTFNNYYAVAEGGGGGAFNADRTAIGEWEEFRFVDTDNGKTAIKTNTGHYVVAEGGGGGAANADRTAIGEWESFTMVSTSGCSPPDQAPIGYLDEASCDLVRGWSFDPNTSSSEIAVQIYKDGPVGSGTLVANTSTTDLRQDVNNAYGITGNHGFAINTPISLKDGNSHTVYAYGINTNAGGNNTLLTNSPKTVFCPVTTVTISANPTLVAYAGSSTISWSSSNATSCIASGDWSGSKPLSGNQPTGNLTQVKTYNYTLTCSGNGSDTKSATVIVSPPPSPTVNLLYNGVGDSTTVGYNSNGTLSWTTGGTVSSCTALSTAGDFSGAKGTSGSESKGPAVSNRTYILSCVGPTGLTGSDSIQIIVTAPTPTTSNVTVTEPNYCVSGPAITVNWNYSDPSGSPQLAYQVQVDDSGSFNNPEVDSGKITSTSTSYASSQSLLEFNKTYQARVRTWNQYDAVSSWVTSSTWKTPQHAYPNVNPPNYNFTWSPTNPPINKPVQFTDRTLFDSSSNNKQWSWTFVPAAGGSGSSTTQNPVYTFNSEGAYQVTESVRDNAMSSGQYCAGPTQAVNIQKPIPIWKEVAPK